MTKLTEDIIRQRLRNCSSPLDLITKINITGRDLEDISLLREMKEIEILSLSVNKISSLHVLQFCENLKELYLRKNNITDINEIFYLKDLPYLKVLGLSENPCSNDINYRMTVIKNLSRVEMLDDIQVTPEERVEAFKKGQKVHNPRSYESDGQSVFESEEYLGSDDKRSNFFGEPILDMDRPFKPNNHMQSSLGTMWNSMSHHPESPNYEESMRYTERMKSNGVNHPNLLAGILILINDLDYKQLELLSLNVKSRLTNAK